MLAEKRDCHPEHMKAMSGLFTQLEGVPELELAIIQATKIHRVLRAILKLHDTHIPQDEVYHFKSRSQALLDKWFKRPDGNPPSEAVPAPVPTSRNTNIPNGVVIKKEEGSATSGRQDAPGGEDDCITVKVEEA